MRLDRSELSKAVQTALSLGAVAAVGIAGTAMAQNAPAPQATQQQPQTLQTIVVTGSHIRRVDLETSNPVVAVTAAQIQATGKLTLGDVVQDLPVITGGLINSRVNNGSSASVGQTLVGLRGLGASRTLVLIDGQRILNNDLNSIPAVAVERIEVLTDGASAIYGSDAIGGVINIILKTNYQGAQFQLNYGISDHNDGERKGASFVFGQTSDKGSILAGVDYNHFDPILQSARKFSDNSLSLTATKTYGAPGTAPAGLTYLAMPGSGITSFVGGSSYAVRNRIFLSPAAQAGLPANLQGCSSLSLNSGTFTSGANPTTADYHCFGTDPATGANDRYNYAAVNYLLVPQERTNAFFKGVYHLSDNVDFYATVYHNKSVSSQQFAPAVVGSGPIGFDTGFEISPQNFWNPFGPNANFTSSGSTYTGRMVPAGPRHFASSQTTDQFIGGFRGNLDILQQNWNWDVGYNFGHFSGITTNDGLPNQNILNAGAGPSFMNSDGVVQCGTAAAPISLGTCTPFNPFNLNNPNTIAAIRAASAPALVDTYDVERIYHADINGGLFNLPAGTVQLAGGVSYRKEYTNNVVSSDLVLNQTTGNCILGSACGAHLQGGYNVKEAYAEIFIPILKDMPFAHALNIDIGDRYSKYSTFGSTSNWKIGLEYRPIEDLLLRGTVAKVFRAPTIGDVFSSPISDAPTLTSDPCNHITTAGNPACQFVPTNGTFINTTVAAHQQIKGLLTGSQFAGFPLGPEIGKSFDFGAVYSPHFVPGLSFSADIWRIYLDNVIASVGAQTVLNSCFAGVTAFCPMITRTDAAGFQGQISRIIEPTANLGRLDVKGTDFTANYKLPELSVFGVNPGQFNVGVQATYLAQFKIQTAPGQGDINQVRNGVGTFGGFGTALGSSCPFAGGGVCFFPRIRAQGTLGWQLGPWSAQWTMRFNSKFKSGSLNPAEGDTALAAFPVDGPAGPLVLKYGSFTYNDVTVGYNIQPLNSRIDVGVDNVFDKQPPLLFANNVLNANTDPNDFDTIGRYYWARLTVNF